MSGVKKTLVAEYNDSIYQSEKASTVLKNVTHKKSCLEKGQK